MHSGSDAVHGQIADVGMLARAPGALRVSFASRWNHAALALRAYNLKGEP
jgi:hypothetical protein